MSKRVGDSVLHEDMIYDAEVEGFVVGGTCASVVNSDYHLMTSDDEKRAPESNSGEAAASMDVATTKLMVVAITKGGFDASSVEVEAGTCVGEPSMQTDYMGGQAAATVLGQMSVPASLSMVKQGAQRLLSKAQPWKEFAVPLSIPSAADIFPRITTNVCKYQTNYTILLVVSLVVSIILRPSALLSVVTTLLAWLVFMKKCQHPGWKPVIMGMELVPVHRWLAMASATAFVLLFFMGSTICNTALGYALFASLHMIVHDPRGSGTAGDEGGNPTIPA